MSTGIVSYLLYLSLSDRYEANYYVRNLRNHPNTLRLLAAHATAKADAECAITNRADAFGEFIAALKGGS